MKPSTYTEAQKIVICACDYQDAEAWALLNRHITFIELDTVKHFERFTFDDGSTLTINGINYTATSEIH